MLLQAIEHFNIDCTQSFMIGDKISDVEAETEQTATVFIK